MQTYTIISEPGGRFRVRMGRHLLPEDFDSEEAALKRVNVVKAPGDRVLAEDEDGYRRTVTRKRWRR